MAQCKCKICGKAPEEILEYKLAAEEKEITPEQFVVENEGTYNPRTHKFYCTNCYIKIRMPLGTA